MKKALQNAFGFGTKPRSRSLNESSFAVGHPGSPDVVPVTNSVIPLSYASLRPKSPKEKLERYCMDEGKPKPHFSVEKVDGKYRATVYVAKTCGRVTGDLVKSKWDAEVSAAQQLLQKLGL